LRIVRGLRGVDDGEVLFNAEARRRGGDAEKLGRFFF
jgi:hypothetical protein